MKRLLLFVILSALLWGLSGCFLDPAESLYAVPKQSQDFYDLQSAIESVMPSGGSYAPPTAGENRQAVQLSDIDGDGENEALVFIRAGGDAPLSVCIFDKTEDRYSLLARLEGSGSSFDQVQYAQIDGVGGNEIVVGRRISEQVTQLLSVYTFHDGAFTELLNTAYSEFITTDLDSDQKTDIVILRTDGDAKNGIAEFYHWMDSQLLRELEARLSAPATAIKRIITGNVSAGIPAVFVASEYEENTIITDVFGISGDVFTNLALEKDADTAVQTVRQYYVYSCDIDNDDIIELPSIIPLKAIPADAASENQSLILWYNLTAGGAARQKRLTYHNYSGGWYIDVDERWAENLAVSQTTVFESASAYRFCVLQEDRLTELFTIAALSGDSIHKAQNDPAWQKLTSKGEISYFCRLGDGASVYSLSDGQLKSMFHFIQIDWNTGETGE